MAKEIPLSQGKVAIVDDQDYEWLSGWKWTYHKRADKREGYAFRTQWQSQERRRKKVFMHRLIADCPKGFEVDHINGDGLDNRRANLRVCSHAENVWNMHAEPKAVSGYRGVFHGGRSGPWQARIRIDGKNRHLGTFPTPEAAAVAYDQAVARYRDEHAARSGVDG